MDKPRTPPLHSVRVVARRTGLTPDLLRAWEKRYGAVQPSRSEGGQRNYSDADIERLRLLVSATEAGRQIGQVARLDNDALREMVAADARLAPPAAVEARDELAVNEYLAGALAAAERFDSATLEATLRTAALRLPSEQMLDRVIGPLLVTIGSGWHDGRFPPANGHLATTIIRRVLTWMTDYPAARDDAPAIIVGTPAFQMHDLGAMLAATAAAGNGWRVTYLGASLPAAELVRAARLADADAVALSIVHPLDDPRVALELRELRATLPTRTALVVGGAGATAYADVLTEIGAERMGSIAALRAWLRARAEQYAAIRGHGLHRGGA
jgi:MerR family transcriptional regulator, light-induced transcriptional regulator